MYALSRYANEEEERAKREVEPGIVPRLHLFFSPLLNAFYWGNSLKVRWPDLI